MVITDLIQQAAWYNKGKGNTMMKMGKQQSLTDIEYGNRKRKTRRNEFLAVMEEAIPWEEWTALVEP